MRSHDSHESHELDAEKTEEQQSIELTNSNSSTQNFSASTIINNSNNIKSNCINSNENSLLDSCSSKDSLFEPVKESKDCHFECESNSKNSESTHTPPSSSSSSSFIKRKVYSLSANNSPSVQRKNLVSESGSIIWDDDSDWIQLYDKVLRLGRSSSFRQFRSCGCKGSQGYNNINIGYDRSDNEIMINNHPMNSTIPNRTTLPSPFKRNSSLPPSMQPKLQMNFMSKSGAADEELFMNSFENVNRIQIFSGKDLEQELVKIKEVCADLSIDWEKRVESLKRFRALLVAGAADHEELYSLLKPLELSFQISLKDLRSQVVREACITVAYLSTRIGIKCDRFAEALLPTLINLIQNSAKIMSSSAIVAIRFIIQYTRTSRLIPIITYNISSKSKEIRKACCEFLDQLLHTWPVHSLERHVGVLQEAIKKGISDADPEARAFSRKAYWGFADKFSQEAEFLLHSLDINKQKMLQDEQLTNSPNGNSLNKIKFNNSNGSIDQRDFARPSSSLSKSSYGSLTRDDSASSRPMIPSMRTSSSIDTDAQRRAKARANLSLVQPKVNTGMSLSRPSQKPNDSMKFNDRMSRVKTRVSQSQPGSRSASPSSKFNYYTTNLQSDGRMNRARRSGIPLSTTTSRETSPTRSLSGRSQLEKRLMNSTPRRRYLSGSESPYLLSENILRRNQEAEFAFENALRKATGQNVRRKYNSYDGQSDESETSSVCSDISFGSSFAGVKTEDVSQVINLLLSTQWSDRKEGLLGLAFILRNSSRTLNFYELKRITDAFTKMLIDPHTKTFTLLLDILNDLIVSYKNELSNWLYIVLTRLFMKIGSDTLGSIQNKIRKTFDIIRESFPCQNQLNVILKFLSDQTQTPNVKVKIVVLQYLNNLIPLLDSSDINHNGKNSHEFELSLMKIISWTADPKSLELRKISQEVIINLFNLSPSKVSILINGLPNTYQDAALQIINKRKSYSVMSSPIRPNLLKVTTSTPTTSYTPTTASATSNDLAKKRNYLDEKENLNIEDVYDSLKKTTDEIQKYKFSIDSVDSVPLNKQKGFTKATTFQVKNGISKEPSYESEDSGISQTEGISPFNCSTPDTINLKQFEVTINVREKDNSNKIDSILSRINFDERHALNDLKEVIKQEKEIDFKCFKDFYRILIDKISNRENSESRALSLKIMAELLTRYSKFFQSYVELTIHRILDASRDCEKEVINASEATASVAAAVLPPEQTLNVLKSIITSNDGQISIAAIKMLTKLIKQQPNQKVIELLPEMMPALFQAYDNPESSVRKAAVFCMVEIHCAVGDLMKPYLATLNGTKIKLLRLYIERAKSESGSTSFIYNNNK